MVENIGKQNACNACFYYRSVSAGNRSCDYILIENHRRPCPPGKDCTVKKARTGKKAAKQKKAASGEDSLQYTT